MSAYVIFIKTVHVNYQLEMQVDATTAAHRKIHKEDRRSEVMKWNFDNWRQCEQLTKVLGRDGEISEGLYEV